MNSTEHPAIHRVITHSIACRQLAVADPTMVISTREAEEIADFYQKWDAEWRGMASDLETLTGHVRPELPHLPRSAADVHGSMLYGVHLYVEGFPK